MAPREPLPVQPSRLPAQPASLAPTALASAAAMLAAVVSPRTASPRTASANLAHGAPQKTAQTGAPPPGMAPPMMGAPIKDPPLIPRLRLEQVRPSTQPTLADATLSSMAAAASSVMSARSVSILGESARDCIAPECIDGSKLDSALDELLNSARGFQVVAPSFNKLDSTQSESELEEAHVTEVPEKFVQPVRHPDGPCRLFLLACGIRGCTPRHC